MSHPLRALFSPAHHLLRAVTLPLKAVAVVGLCFAINALTSPGHWWVKWVALGMGIAVLVAWARALRSALGLGLVAAVGWWLYRRHGAQAKARFDAWVARGL